MNKQWIKWVVLGAIVVGALIAIYLKYGIGMFLVGALCWLAGKFLKWKYVTATFDAVDKFMTGLFSKPTSAA